MSERRWGEPKAVAKATGGENPAMTRRKREKTPAIFGCRSLCETFAGLIEYGEGRISAFGDTNRRVETPVAEATVGAQWNDCEREPALEREAAGESERPGASRI